MHRSAFDILQEQEEFGKSCDASLAENAELKEYISMLIFEVNNKQYASRLEDVTEVINHKDLTNLPGSHEVFTGLINFRGDLLPILDLSYLISEEKIPINKRNKILVVKSADKSAGIMVNRIYTQQKIEKEMLSKEQKQLIINSKKYAILDLKQVVHDLEQVI